jgi:hypothetical protein
VSASPAAAEFNGTATKTGVDTKLTNTELDRATRGQDIQTGAPDQRSFDYKNEYPCSLDAADARDACLGTVVACASNTPAQGQGPLATLYRREVGADGAPTLDWQLIGSTCFPELLPGKRVVGMGLVVAEFHNTAWAKPTVHIQPEGNITLVTLPAYFEVNWPTEGFQPGEIDTAPMLGYEVRIRPTVEGYTYVFGDGTSFGPTGSSGGPYPSGDITHAYPRAGSFDTRIDITYGGEFSINGGAWISIPDTVTVAGPVQTLTVKTARARLVTK